MSALNTLVWGACGGVVVRWRVSATAKPDVAAGQASGVSADACILSTSSGASRVKHTSLGGRWVIERANSWLSNFGQIRRSTDRDPKMRLRQIALAVALILIVKLIDWRNRYQPT